MNKIIERERERGRFGFLKREGYKWAEYGPVLGRNGGPGICKDMESTVPNYKEIMVSNQ